MAISGEEVTDTERADSGNGAVRESNTPQWKKLLDGQTFLEKRDKTNPWKDRTDSVGMALSFLWKEYWVPRAEVPREILAGLTTGLSGDWNGNKWDINSRKMPKCPIFPPVGGFSGLLRVATRRVPSISPGWGAVPSSIPRSRNISQYPSPQSSRRSWLSPSSRG